MTKQMFILRGLPGDGKSTYARSLAAKGATIVSADDYFVGSDGVYRFDPSRLTAAHVDCFTRARRLCANNATCVVVDNTNTTRSEYTPYVMLGRSYEYHVSLVEVRYIPQIQHDARGLLAALAARTTHNVPQATIERMSFRWEKSRAEDPDTIYITN